MIDRKRYRDRVFKALSRSRAVCLLGPRQCGKSTLAREIANERPSHYFDLEDPGDEARLSNPKLTLERYTGLIVIDEVQLMPEIFSVLRVLIDRSASERQFLLLGSASPHLVRGLSDSLAGRIEYVDMGGFTPVELGYEREMVESSWLRGGFPLSYLADTEEDSLAWRGAYVRSLTERDMPQMGMQMMPRELGRFLRMLAHVHGQVWNSSSVASSFQVAHTTVRRYVDTLTGMYMVRQLPPWTMNLGKRQVKSPKLYIRDAGVLHYLAGIRSMSDLESNPLLGSSWEGFVLETLLMSASDDDVYFWSTYSGAELDLLVVRGTRKIGFEIKYTSRPVTTKSMHSACEMLDLNMLYVVYPGAHCFPLTECIEAVTLKEGCRIVDGLT